MFGDFKLDGLRAGPHTLTLSIDKPAFQPWQTQLTIAAESIVLDPITLATG
jgi:hypothetical protein